MSTNGVTAPSHFEPSRYLTKISNADYLEVKWRLVWLRHEHPDAVIETELIEHTQQAALFRARIAIPGGGVATGYGSETAGDFRDYVEKAETKAIGRALAALGFGTQFCPDFEFGATSGRVVDSPVDISRTRGWANNRGDGGPGQENGAATGQRRVNPLEQPATERQVQFLQTVARSAGLDDNGLRSEIRNATDGDRLQLTRREASALIDRLKAMVAESDARPPPAPTRTVPPDVVGQERTEEPAGTPRKPPAGIQMTEKQWWKMWACGNEKMPRQADEGLHAFANHTFGHDSLKDVTVEEASKLIDWLEGRDEAQVMVYVGPLLRQRGARSGHEPGQQELPIAGAPRQYADVAPA
jgi:hypothetical protein